MVQMEFKAQTQDIGYMQSCASPWIKAEPLNMFPCASGVAVPHVRFGSE